MIDKKNFIFGVIAMALVVLVSNLLVVYPVGQWLTWAAFTYPIAFFVTDIVNKISGKSTARKVVFVGFVFGVVLSWILGEPRIALASGAAFLSSQLLDIFIFDSMRKAKWWKAPLVSSAVSSAVDTSLFFSLAFVGTGVPWVTLGMGDFVVKMFMAAMLLIPFRIAYTTLSK